MFLNSLIGPHSCVTSLDLWPIQSCSLFDIKPAAAAVSRFEDRFYENYVDVGQFPGVSSTMEEILVRLTRSLTGMFRGQMLVRRRYAGRILPLPRRRALPVVSENSNALYWSSEFRGSFRELSICYNNHG